MTPGKMKECSVSARKVFQDLDEDDIAYLQAELDNIVTKSNVTGQSPNELIQTFLRQQELILKQSRLAKMKTQRAYESQILPLLQESKDPHTTLKSILGYGESMEGKNFAPVEMVKSRYTDKLLQYLGRVESKFPAVIERYRKGDPELLLDFGRINDGTYKGGDPGTIELHRVLRAMYDDHHTAKLRAGFNVGFIPNYMGTQRHPGAKWFKAQGPGGIDKWMDIAKKYMDLKGTDEEVTQYLSEFYHTISNDSPRSFWDMSDDFGMVVKKGKKARLERGRSITFKSSEAYFQYLIETGQNHLENVIKDVEGSAAELAMAEVFGPMHKNSFLKALSEVKGQMELKGEGSKFQKVEKDLKGRYEYLLRGAQWGDDPVTFKMLGKEFNFSVKSVGEAIGKTADMALLNNSLLSTMPDLGLSANVVSATTGKNVVETSAEVMGKFARNFANMGQAKEVAIKLGVFIDDVLGHMAPNRLSDGEVNFAKGALDRVHHWKLKAVGLSRFDSALRKSASQSLARNLAEVSELTWDKLHSPLKRALEAQGLKAQDWDVLKHATFELPNKTKIIAPEDIDALDLSLFPGDSQISRGQARSRISNAVYSYYKSITSKGSPEGGLDFKYWMSQYDPHSLTGQSMRLMFKYKPIISAYWRGVKYVQDTGGGKLGNVKGVAALAASSMILASMQHVIKEWAINGKDLGEIDYGPEAFMKVAAYSGMGGLYGEFLMGDRGILDNFLGPVFGRTGVVGGGFHLADQVKNELKGKQVRDVRGFRSNLNREGVRYLHNNFPTVPYLKNRFTREYFKELQMNLY